LMFQVASVKVMQSPARKFETRPDRRNRAGSGQAFINNVWAGPSA
jgi:hypothetical protein